MKIETKQTELIFGTTKDHIYPQHFIGCKKCGDACPFAKNTIALMTKSGQSYFLDLEILKTDPTEPEKALKMLQPCNRLEESED